MTVLVQSCSATKREADTPTPALDLYDGYFYRIIRKASREVGLPADVEIVVLSAKYGLIDSGRKIMPYDQRMTAERADELATEVAAALAELVDEGGHDRVVVNAGETYRLALEPARDRVDAEFRQIPGDGIGRKGSHLKQYLHGDASCLTGWK